MPLLVPFVHQRSSGRVDIAFKRRQDKTVIDRLHQQGCAKARLPRATPCEVVLINMAGGLTGGDHLDQSVEWQAGTSAVVTTQAAEKVYRAVGQSTATISTKLLVANAARAEWLPQESILFDRARINRRIEVDVDPDGYFLGTEAWLFGRSAMGEQVQNGSLRDNWTIRRGGQLLLIDPLRLDGPIAEILARTSVTKGNLAVASLFYVGADVEDRLEQFRTILEKAKGEAGVSRMGDLLVSRFVANDGQVLRHDLALCLDICRLNGAGLPKQWQI